MGTNERRRRINRSQLIWLAAFLILLIAAAWAYNQWRINAKFIQVQFVSGKQEKSPIFSLEVAATEPERRKGLMFRKPDEMGALHGMLFIFPNEEVQHFWMKNTYIPLDMIFVGQDLKIVGIVRDAGILSQESFSVNKPSKYVIELHAGSTKKFGIEEGAELRIVKDRPARPYFSN